MAKVFLSHNSAQKQLVEQVASKVGLDNIFMDEFNFQAGNVLTEEIKRAINASSIFVLFLSKEAQASDWVNLEVDLITPRLLGKKIIFLPFIVDEGFTHNNLKEDWVWMKDYLLRTYDSSYLIAHIIKEKIAGVNPDIHSQAYARRITFAGRDDEMRSIQSEYSSTISTYRRAIIVSGMPHIGRKRLLKEALIQRLEANLPKTYEPLCISLSVDDQIENFIDQLNDILHPSNILNKMAVDKQKQLDLAVELLQELDEYNRKLVIEDSNCIVRANGHLTEWFLDIIQSQRLQNKTYFLIASRYAVDSSLYRTNPYVQFHQIGAIQQQGMKTLFNEYAKNRGIVTADLSKEADWFTSQFTGYPEQALFAVDEIAKTDLYHAKLYFPNYLQIYKNDLADIVKTIEKNPKTLQLLILLSRFEFISIEFIYRIMDDFWENGCLEELHGLCLYEVFGSMKQYIRLNPALANYVRRNRATLKLSKKYEEQLNKLTAEIVNDINDDSLDLSAKLYAIKETIRHNPQNVSATYLLPSYALKVIIEEYQHGNYPTVITIANRVLYEYNRDCYDSIIYPIRHWLCMAYCHEGDERLQDELQYFDKNSNTYHYLLGFAARLKGDYRTAQKHLEIAVGDYLKSPRRSLAKSAHELVLAYMMQGLYEKALDLAKQNYEIERTNAYHIEAYFRCLVNTNNATAEILETLISDMQRSYDQMKDFYMDNFKAEYEFYINSNFDKAIDLFEDICIKYGKDYKNYTRQAIQNICKKYGKREIYNNFIREHANYIK